MQGEIIVVEDPRELPRIVAERMARTIRSAIAERDWCYLALPAGPFVRPIYEDLALASLDWSKVEFYFSEERGVPSDHPASAYAQAIVRLSENRRIGAHQFHRVEAAGRDLETAAERYAEECPEAFDLMLFEPGADGHLGALWPGSPAFDEKERLAIPLEVSTKPRRRVALAPGVIRGALDVVVAAGGSERAAVVARVLEGEEDERTLPAALLRGRTWILDRPAASRLTRVAP